VVRPCRPALHARRHQVHAEGPRPPAVRDLLGDYSTCYAHIARSHLDGTTQQIGIGYLKFRTFEDFAGFLASFQITGTGDPLIQLQARMRFIAFTAQFVQREYDPLALPATV
jgi:hypothetical protein